MGTVGDVALAYVHGNTQILDLLARLFGGAEVLIVVYKNVVTDFGELDADRPANTPGAAGNQRNSFLDHG